MAKKTGPVQKERTVAKGRKGNKTKGGGVFRPTRIRSVKQ